jgi:hypothetical protein
MVTVTKTIFAATGEPGQDRDSWLPAAALARLERTSRLTSE